jgi:DNA-directed RNA polymerase subunit F
MTIEKKILSNLIRNEEFSRRALPFVKREYFQNEADKVIFHEVHDFILKYNELPKISTLQIEIDKIAGLKPEVITEAIQILDEFSATKDSDNIEWLIDTTEKYCQERAIYNAIMSSVDIINDTKKEKGVIPKLLSDALAVSFDPNVGHDYLEEFDARWKSYHRVARKIKF